jgi:hypothetical protein
MTDQLDRQPEYVSGRGVENRPEFEPSDRPPAEPAQAGETADGGPSDPPQADSGEAELVAAARTEGELGDGSADTAESRWAEPSDGPPAEPEPESVNEPTGADNEVGQGDVGRSDCTPAAGVGGGGVSAETLEAAEGPVGDGEDARPAGEDVARAEPSSADEVPNMPADRPDPDAENHAGLDGPGASSPDMQRRLHRDERAAGRNAGADAGQAGQDRPAQDDSEQRPPPDQQRIGALEAESSDTRQQLASARQQIAELQAKNDEQSARLDRIEELLADARTSQVDASAKDHDRDKLGGPAEHQTAQDAAIAEHEGSRQTADTKDAHRLTWRRVASADNFGIASTALGAADTVTQFAMHATPEGMVALGSMAFGLASLGMAKLEKRKENKKA